MTTTTVTTWTRLFSETIENAANPDPSNELGLADDERKEMLDEAISYFVTKADSILSPYDMEILANGEIIGEIGGDWEELDDKQWDDLREELGMIDTSSILDQYAK